MNTKWRVQWGGWMERVRGRIRVPRRRSAGGAGGGAAVGGGMPAASAEQAALLEELQVAHREWVCAQHRLDYVLGDDEIDYAIFALETAEKRYGMLLKRAKAMKVTGRGTHRTALHLPTSGKTMEG